MAGFSANYKIRSKPNLKLWLKIQIMSRNLKANILYSDWQQTKVNLNLYILEYMANICIIFISPFVRDFKMYLILIA